MTDHQISAAITALEERARQGDGEAAYHLGLIFANGDGVPLAYPRAVEWLERAIDAGHGGAMRVLAMLYAAGFGVPLKESETRRLLLAAAEAGDLDAQYAAGAMLQFGHYGMPTDLSAMERWYRIAADRGHARAQFALGRLLAQGDLIPRDDEEAFRWLTLAAKNGSRAAPAELEALSQRLGPSRTARQ